MAISDSHGDHTIMRRIGPDVVRGKIMAPYRMTAWRLMK